MNIYAPATHSDRYAFYDQLLQQPLFQALLNNMHTADGMHNNYLATVPDAPSIVLGDFNYNFRQYRPPPTVASTNIHPQWLFHSVLTHYYQESTHELSQDPLVPTFRRNTTLSTIDYMFMDPQLLDFRTDHFVHFVHSEWTDHALLSTQLTFANPDFGKGLWRINPQLAHNKFFQQRLFAKLGEFHDQIASESAGIRPQEVWDQLKAITRQVARSCSRRQAEWRRRLLCRLQSKRNKYLRLYKTTQIRNDRLPQIEAMIGHLQQELTDIQALRSGIKWREQGEKSAGFLKRLATQRTQQRAIPTLIHPISTTTCETTTDKQAAAVAYYDRLYTADAVDIDAIRYFTDQIPATDQIPDSEHPALCEPFTLDDLADAATRAPKQSSPGIDSIPYAIIQLLLTHTSTAAVALRVYSDALLHGLFPQSWQETCLVLLPKKGDLSLLQNWRPISLICCDAKIFTRLLNARLMEHFRTRLSSSQSGFMPQRFIGEPAMILHCAQSLATATQSTSIALLLDQEKAYDRVNLDYLSAILTAFNMPPQLTSSLLALLATTQVQVNINGNLSAPFTTHRGMRQGDPISPLLFNIIFDPFLRAINNHPNIQGFDFDYIANTNSRFPTPLTHHVPVADPVKVLAYADDTLVFLNDLGEFYQLQQLVSRYADASNASLNYHKTQALSLSGASHASWIAGLRATGISSWHDKTATSPITYLGYPVCSSPVQRVSYVNNLLSRLRDLCRLHSIRTLTLRGRVTVLNSLLFSKVWHVARLFPFSATDIRKLQHLGASFVNNQAKLTRFSFSTLCLPRSQGGLNLLDPAKQINALQWRWLHPLLHPANPTPPTKTSIPYIRVILNFFLATPSYPTYHWSLLSPACRPSRSTAITAPLYNLLRAVDAIARKFGVCHVPFSTCLRLPLATLIEHSLPSSHSLSATFCPPQEVTVRCPGVLTLTGNDVLTFDPATQALQVRISTRGLPHPTTSRRALQLLQSEQLLFANFVHFNRLLLVPRPVIHHIDLSTITSYTESITHISTLLISLMSSSFSFESHSFLMSLPTNHGYKSLPLHTNMSSFSSPLGVAKWKQFWALQIPLNARNTWFRILHEKVTTRQLLHQRMRDQFPPYCLHCQSSSSTTPPAIEDTEHFLFSCPLKLEVWRHSLSLYISPRFAHFAYEEYLAILHLRLTLDRSSHELFPDLSVFQVFACIQQAIWSAHYCQVFQHSPFIPSIIIHSIHRALHHLGSQLSFDTII
ncbi:60S acidic ribosomal protein P2 [Mucor velutinosus]|uniref:60S acidic ribosomal protein P2 n=1 Tax=Mucor velutinosus TaxID=708070 RepID=A0AAN7DH31_9FUNG|nr:60S acidic ribosomal protein P2 [Mucor velutinosus]